MQDGFTQRALAEQLPPARHRDAKQEGDEQAGKRCFARDRGNRRECPAGLARFLDCGGEAIDRCVQASGDFTNGAGDVRGRIDGTLGHAGLGRGLRYLRAQGRDLLA